MEIGINQVSEKETEQGQIQDGPPIVFMREKSLFGDQKPLKSNWLTHTEMFEALSKNIDASHITGLQRVNGLWRIYIDNLGDKVTLLAHGLTLRGYTVPLLSTNPGRLDGEQTLKVRIKDIPLSVDDGILTRTLILIGVEVISSMREKLRINGKLVNCATGDRLITIKASSLKPPLKRFMSFSHFTGKVFHYGQEKQRILKCSKCLEEGHAFNTCENGWKCTVCLEFGHKRDTCESDPANTQPQHTDPNDQILPSVLLDNHIPSGQSCSNADNTESCNTPVKTYSKVTSGITGDQAIKLMMNSGNDKTPNNRKSKTERSPPTPAENLNLNSKKKTSQSGRKK